jgi:uncharacterized protein (DUF934 family)
LRAKELRALRRLLRETSQRAIRCGAKAFDIDGTPAVRREAEEDWSKEPQR